MGLRAEGFWDKHYELELRNFENDGDEGDIWFGKGFNRRIANWIVDNIALNSIDCKVLDIGCGNSFTLRTVLSLYTDRVANTSTSMASKVELVGIDYSSNSIELSRRILEAQKITNQQISISQCDFLDTEKLRSCNIGTDYDYIVDKGTYDAICLLCPEDELRKIQIKYMKSLRELIKDGTRFILASCNHTEDELASLLTLQTGEKSNLLGTIAGRIETPTFQFGGKTGSQVCCIIVEFKKVIN